MLLNIALDQYNRFENVITSAGITQESFIDSNLDYSDCLTLCEHTDGCRNIEFCPEVKGCVMNDKIITDPKEPTKEKGSCFTAYKTFKDGNKVFIVFKQCSKHIYHNTYVELVYIKVLFSLI